MYRPAFPRYPELSSEYVFRCEKNENFPVNTHQNRVWTNTQHDETTQATRDATRRHNLRHGDTICDTATRSATRPTRGATRTTRDATRATRNATRRHEMRHDDTRRDTNRKKGHKSIMSRVASRTNRNACEHECLPKEHGR